jgi:hypothetical protein
VPNLGYNSAKTVCGGHAMDNKIKGLLKTYKAGFNIDTQRAELLSRNTVFVKEYENLKASYPIELTEAARLFHGILERRVDSRTPVRKIAKTGVEYSHFKIDLSEAADVWRFYYLQKRDVVLAPGMIVENTRPAIAEGEGPDPQILVSIELDVSKWKQFCQRWNISPNWDGNLSSLQKCLGRPVELYWIEGEQEGAPTLLIEVNNWTTLKDVRAAWGEVEDLQNEIWKKQEKKTNFARDLCWYDLTKEHGLKPKDIAKLWEKYFPHEIDLLVARRMKEDISEADLKGRRLDDNELLKAIKSGFLAQKYGAEYQDESKYYLRGESPGNKKFNAPFVDAIKKALRRMEQQITQISTTSLRTTMMLEQVLKSGRAITSHS